MSNLQVGLATSAFFRPSTNAVNDTADCYRAVWLDNKHSVNESVQGGGMENSGSTRERETRRLWLDDLARSKSEV